MNLWRIISKVNLYRPQPAKKQHDWRILKMSTLLSKSAIASFLLFVDRCYPFEQLKTMTGLIKKEEPVRCTGSWKKAKCQFVEIQSETSVQVHA